MNEHSSENFQQKLENLLRDFIIQYVKCKPTDALLFAVEYFNDLNKLSSWKDVPRTIDKTKSCASSSMISGSLFYKTCSRRAAISDDKYSPDTVSEILDPSIENDIGYQDFEQIKEATRSVFLFNSLNEEELDIVIKNMIRKDTKPGEIIIEKNEEGDYFYIVGSGIFEAFMMNNKEPICVKKYHGEGYFGEIALMYNCPRTATVISRNNGTLWALDRKKFKEIVLNKAFEKRTNCYKILRKIDIFKSLNNYELNHIADSLYRKRFHANENIITQGDNALEMYIIESGEVLVTRTENNIEKVLFHLHTNDYFGEISFITNNYRQVSAYAISDVELMVISKEAFERLLGPCLSFLRKNLDKYEN